MIMFVPIKHNSQRVPNKNFRKFKDHSLYKFFLKKYSKDRFSIFVDTDSDLILHECATDPDLRHVKAYKRQSFLCGDKVSVCSLIENFINQFDISDPIIQAHVTSPFLEQSTLVDAYTYIDKYDSVVSCNIHNSRFWRKESYGFCPFNHNPMKLEQTQDLPTLYEENSSFYILKPDIFLKTGNRIGKNPFFYSMKYPENLDIDTEEDWELAIKEAKNEKY